MAPRLAPLLLASAALVLAVPTALAQAGCDEPVAVADPANDQTLFPAGPAPEPVRQPAMDLLGTTLALDGADVVITATLGAVPTAEAAYSYRYWFGFHVKAPGGEPEYMDVRMHGKGDLAGAPVITSNERGLETIAVVAPAWNGTTATFRFPLALLHEVYGTTDLLVGQPQASTDGPFNQETLMWFPTGVVYQVDAAPASRGPWVPYEPCPQPAAAQPVPDTQEAVAAALPGEPAPQGTGSDPAAPVHDVPALGLALAAGLLAAAAVARRR